MSMLIASRRSLAQPLVLITLAAGLATTGLQVRAQAAKDADEAFIEAYRSAEPITTWPEKKLQHEIPEIKGLKPAADPSALAATLKQAAQRLETSWKDFENTSSLETIQESRQRTHGPVLNVDQAVQQFRYLMLTDPANPLAIEEYRTDMQGRARDTESVAAGFLRTSGFTSLPLMFGAREQALADFRDLGTEQIHQHSYRVVAFAQHVDPAAFSRWHLADEKVPILIQGVAWIDPADGQVVEMRTDLLAPLPSVSLYRATTVVTLAPVQFRSSHKVLWLPQDVTVTIELGDYTFINHHHYSDYQVFAVSTGRQRAHSN